MFSLYPTMQLLILQFSSVHCLISIVNKRADMNFIIYPMRQWGGAENLVNTQLLWQCYDENSQSILNLLTVQGDYFLSCENVSRQQRIVIFFVNEQSTLNTRKRPCSTTKFENQQKKTWLIIEVVYTTYQSCLIFFFAVPILACVVSVRRGGKGKRRALAREDRTREDRVPSPSRAHFDFPPFLRPATRAIPIHVHDLSYIHTLVTLQVSTWGYREAGNVVSQVEKCYALSPH